MIKDLANNYLIKSAESHSVFNRMCVLRYLDSDRNFSGEGVVGYTQDEVTSVNLFLNTGEGLRPYQ